MEIELTQHTKLSVIVEALASGKRCKLVVEKPVEKSFFGVKHFQKSEFACKCGGRYCDGYPAEVSETLAVGLDTLREYCGKPVIISSGLRCEKHNVNVGGVVSSWHKKGRAADFAVCGQTAQETINSVVKIGLKYCELYAIDQNYVHIAF